jgi:pimeloyl-ACP methyl ester carboxylesterase
VRRWALRLTALLAVVLSISACGLYAPDRPRAELEARYAAPPSRFEDVLGLRVHLRDAGPRDAPAVVLLHGFASSLHAWDGWAPELERTHRVVRLDLPGFGLTGPDATGDYTDARAFAILNALLDRLGIARTAVLGSSMGGRIAWGFAAAHPERVTRLVLLAPDGFASPGLRYDQPPRVPLLLRALPYTLPDFLLRPSIAAAFAEPASLTPELYARYRDMMLAPGVRGAVVARVGQHVLRDPQERLASLRMPVLLLWGSEDRMVPVSNAADYQAVIPQAELVVLQGIGHVPMEESPARSLAPVLAFLAGDLRPAQPAPRR